MSVLAFQPGLPLSHQPSLVSRISSSRCPSRLPPVQTASLPLNVASSSVPLSTTTFASTSTNTQISIPSSNSSPSGPTTSPVDIVLTHATADFDSLAAAVGLARLRSPEARVVIPAGVHPAVRRYLSLHKSLFPIIDAKLVDETRLNWLAIVDTRSKKRIGTASNWLSHAPHVLILDHHTAPDPFEIRPSDVGGRLQIIGDHVGAVTTVIVERIMLRPDIILSRAECTLLALAIHADTGSLTFDSTTPRDAAALAWLLAKGACQRSVSQFARAYLTTPQQHLLANALDCMVVQNVAGTRLAHVVLESEEFVKGMAGVAQAALELSNIDALVLAVVAPAGRGRRGIDSTKQVSIIGRARSTVECVNFAPLLSPLGGGGHAHAASASVKVRGGEEVGRLVETVLEGVMNQLPPPVLAEACMSTGVVGVTADQTMREARDLLYESGHTGVIVTKNEGDEKLIGIISRQDVALAERRGKLETPVKGWVARKVIFVKPTTALHEIEALLVDNNIGRVPVVDDGKVIGIVTRSNVLMQRRLCSPLEEEG